MGVVAREDGEVTCGEVTDVGVCELLDVDSGGVFGDEKMVFVARDGDSFAA